MRKLVMMIFVTAIIIYSISVVVLDVKAYVRGDRPRFAIVDGICGIFLRPNRDNLLARVPIQGEQVQLTVSHKWRGNYQFLLWVPEVIKGFVSSSETIGMDCLFYDRNGNVVYTNKSPPSVYSFWRVGTCNGTSGSDLAFRMYTAPKDVPLDDTLNAEIKFYGHFKEFLITHSNACLILVKERDK